MKGNNWTGRVTTNNSFVTLRVLCAIASTPSFWLFVSFIVGHEVFPRVPFAKHLWKNAFSPKLCELGQNRIPVFLVRQNPLVEKFGCVAAIKSTHNKVAVISFYCKQLLLCLTVTCMVLFNAKFTRVVNSQCKGDTSLL